MEELHVASASFKQATCAIDGWHPRHFRLLSDQVLQVLANILAVAETLGELDYWTPAVHKAAFALPAFVARRMSSPAPPAPPTSDESS